MTDRREPAQHPVRDLLAYFDARYQERIGLKYAFKGGRDAKLIAELRETYTDDQLRTFMAAYFEIEDDFIEQSGHSLQVFRGCLPKVIQFVRKGTTKPVPKNLQGIQAWMQKRALGE